MRDTATVIITVVAQNQPPVAVNDYYEAGCSTIVELITRNDYDPDNNKITVSVRPLLPPRHGTVSILANGTMVYEASKGFVGVDSLRYEICDDGWLPACDTATVYIDVFKDENCDDIPDEEGPYLWIPKGSH